MSFKESTIAHTELENFKWVNVTAVTLFEIAKLQSEFGFEMEDLKRCLPPIQSPHVLARNDYIFLILLLPIFDRDTGLIHRTEVDFFITKNTLVTLHDGGLHGLDSLFASCIARHLPAEIKTHNPAELAFSITRFLLNNIHPMLVHVANDIDEIRRSMFESSSREVIDDILRIHTNVATLRTIAHTYKRCIEKFEHFALARFPWHSIENSFPDLLSDVKEDWDSTELHHQAISAIHQSYSSFVSTRTNEVIKTLTLFSVIVFPLTLLVALSDLSIPGNPLRAVDGSFWLVILFLISGSVGMFIYYKKKHWV